MEKKQKKIVSEVNLFRKKTFDFLVIGARGLLGSEIYSLLNKNLTISVARKQSDYNLNLNKYKKLDYLFKKIKFKYVINCAGITNLSLCEKNYTRAKKINTELPKFLSERSKKYKFKLIHISTDHFFKNKNFKLNSEKQKIYSLNNYSSTKKNAEKYVRKNKKNLIIRTNFTGFKKYLQSTFIGWVSYNLIRKKKMNLFNDMYASTLDVNYCAKVIINLIKKGAVGIYNVGSRDAINKLEFAKLYAKKLKKTIKFNAVSTDVLKVSRGKYLGLDVNKTEKKLCIKMINSKKVVLNLSKFFFKI